MRALILYHVICICITCVCCKLIVFYYATGEDVCSRYPPVSNLKAHRTLTLHGGSGALSTIFSLRYQRSAERKEEGYRFVELGVK